MSRRAEPAASAAELFDSVDPARVTIPTGNARSVRYVADLSDAELDEQEDIDLGQIAKAATEWGFELEESGVVRELLDTLDGAELRRLAANRVNRASVRVRAYRIERKRRAQSAKDDAAQKAGDARAACEAMLEQAPRIAAAHVERIEEALAAFRDLAGFLRKCELVLALPDLCSRHSQVLGATSLAASALERPAPTLAPAPDGIPAANDVGVLLRALFGTGEQLDGRGLLPELGPTTKVHRRAHALSNAGPRARR